MKNIIFDSLWKNIPKNKNYRALFFLIRYLLFKYPNLSCTTLGIDSLQLKFKIESMNIYILNITEFKDSFIIFYDDEYTSLNEFKHEIVWNHIHPKYLLDQIENYLDDLNKNGIDTNKK